MKEIIIHTQAELDALPKRFSEFTIIKITNTTEQISVVARGNSSVVAWENSSVEAWENSSVEARENSSVVARENSSVVARGNSSVVAWENSSVVAWENSSVYSYSSSAEISLYGFAVLFLIVKCAYKKISKYCHIQKVKNLGWFENNGIKKTKEVILYKRVSIEFKTQEGESNETLWVIGSTVNHPKWNPNTNECGEGKYHACSRPYFCDEFRSTPGDKYVAIKIALKDLHEWKNNPSCPHKIGFRRGEVLWECDKFGKKI